MTDHSSTKAPLFVWGIFDSDGRVALEVFDTLNDQFVFQIKSDPFDRDSTLLLTEHEARCILKHLQAAVAFLDGYLAV